LILHIDPHPSVHSFFCQEPSLCTTLYRHRLSKALALLASWSLVVISQSQVHVIHSQRHRPGETTGLHAFFAGAFYSNSGIELRYDAPSFRDSCARTRFYAVPACSQLIPLSQLSRGYSKGERKEGKQAKKLTGLTVQAIIFPSIKRILSKNSDRVQQHMTITAHNK